jgi:hypothetical protein
MPSGVPETCHLRVLRRQVVDRVEQQIGHRERAVDDRRREVPDRDVHRRAAGFRPQLGDHRPRQVDAVDRHTAPRHRQRDPPGPDPELQRPSITRKLRQHIDNRIHALGLEPPRRVRVIPLRDLGGKVPVCVQHTGTVSAGLRSITCIPTAAGTHRRGPVWA